MADTSDYLAHNRNTWNSLVPHHLASDFYAMQAFREGANTLRKPELNLLGDVQGKRILHLQCHFGQDSLSLARMGAHVTGVDLSDVAIDTARRLATELELEAEFICCDIYSLPNHLQGHFDLVFTSYGTIGWLPDLEKWATVIAHFLKPGGLFVFAEFHPVVWMFDNVFEEVAYSYFNRTPVWETKKGTYADREAAVEQTTVCWNHALDEVIGSLLGQGLSLTSFAEYDYSPYPIFKNQVQTGEEQYQVKGLEGKLPLLYTLVVEKSGLTKSHLQNP